MRAHTHSSDIIGKWRKLKWTAAKEKTYSIYSLRTCARHKYTFQCLLFFPLSMKILVHNKKCCIWSNTDVTSECRKYLCENGFLSLVRFVVVFFLFLDSFFRCTFYIFMLLFILVILIEMQFEVKTEEILLRSHRQMSTTLCTVFMSRTSSSK